MFVAAPFPAQTRRVWAFLACAGSLFFGGGFAFSQSASQAITDTPLAHRSGPRGPTLFTKLEPEQTGITTENRYADPAMWANRFPEFTLGPIGTGIAIGDFDNDGRPDITVTESDAEIQIIHRARQ